MDFIPKSYPNLSPAYGYEHTNFVNTYVGGFNFFEYDTYKTV